MKKKTATTTNIIVAVLFSATCIFSALRVIWTVSAGIESGFDKQIIIGLVLRSVAFVLWAVALVLQIIRIKQAKSSDVDNSTDTEGDNE